MSSDRRVSDRVLTVFWDIVGVLLTNGWDETQRSSLLGRLGVDLAAYEARHAQEIWYWERGLITAEEFFRRTVFAVEPGLKLSPAELWKLVCEQSRKLHPECFELLHGMKMAGGLRLATLNNESRELNDYRLDAFALRTCFDLLVCSGYVGEMKPAPPFFRLALEVSSTPPQSALFIDDKQENCAAARAHGMNAIHFRSPAQLRAELHGFGLQLMQERQAVCN